MEELDIKYRQYVGGRKLFHYWGYLEAGHFVSPLTYWNGESLEKVGSDSFTGVLDTHGTEIYEKDIISMPGDPCCLVLWHPDGYFSINGGWQPLGRYDLLEIVGNAYQNKDLLS